MCLGLLREAPHRIKASLFWCSVYSSRCSVVSIMNRLWAGRFGVRIPGSARDDLFFKTSTPAPGSTQPSLQWTPGFSPGDKAASAWSSSPSSTYCEVKSSTYASPIQVPLLGVGSDGCTLVWSLDNAIFFFIISTLLLLHVQSNSVSVTSVYATPRV